MSELSGFFTTGGATGDQQASYTQAQLAIAHKIMAACSNFEGIAPSFLTELAFTASGANTVTMAEGGAMVDGLWYYNDSPQNINIPSAAAGLTRIDRIVLRADWAGFNVSVHRIAGTDHANPTPPAITQNSGTTYDILCVQVEVDDAGNCTVTDEKTFAAAPVDGVTLEERAGSLRIKDNGISNAKLRDSAALSVIGRSANSTGDPADIAASSDGQVLRRSGTTLGFGTVATAGIANNAIDDTKVGNRVPQFYRRQGSNATDWTFAGDTGYVPSAVRMQAGARSSSASGEVTVSFPVAFSAPPLVFLQLRDVFQGVPSANIAIADIRNVTANGFAFAVYKSDGTRIARIVNWFAVGPE